MSAFEIQFGPVVTSAKALEHVIAARAKIENPKTWTKGYLTRKGCMCAWEALRSTIVGGKPGERADPDAAAELKAVGNLFRPFIAPSQMITPSSFHPLIRFNDQHARKHVEVLAVFDCVIDKLRAEVTP